MKREILSSTKREITNEELITKWTNSVSPDKPFPEYPRPQMKRSEWMNLNGIWRFRIAKRSNLKRVDKEGKILIPFPIESTLSGVKEPLKPTQYLIYEKTFSLPDSWHDKSILLHFGAVDWECNVWINDQFVGSHKGGYCSFSFEISDYIIKNDENTLRVRVWDPTNRGKQERGKQVLNPWTVFYTAVSGIWQTVWLEPVNRQHIKHLWIQTDIDNEAIKIKSLCEGIKDNVNLRITLKEENKKIVEKVGLPNEYLSLSLPNPKLWTPENPHLYDLRITLENKQEICDSVSSYVGMRKISIKKDQDGVNRFHLNNEPLFLLGTLDQGYWPDGLYTAPTDTALKYDVELTKELGFNLIRKHIKVEPSRWYYHCDKLGMLVWQDMPNGGNLFGGIMGIFTKGKFGFCFGRRNKSVRTQFYHELKEMIDMLYNHPSVITWVTFNEGWGQFETTIVTEYVRNLDSTRLVNSASGWYDKHTGDISDIHAYPGPKIPKLEKNRVAVLGEFGGLGLKVANHMWKFKKPFTYKIFETKEDLTQAYIELLEKTKKLIPKGLSAAIYTQTTDVEKEVNGLLTYDRAILKMDKEKIQKKNKELVEML